MKPRLLGAAALALASSLFAPAAGATTSTDLAGLVTQLQQIDASLTTATFSPSETCVDLGALSTAIKAFIAAEEQAYGRLTSPQSPTAADLANLGQLSALALDMAGKAKLISLQTKSVDGVYSLVEIRSGLSAMLRLSTDIGTMADRILEMANRILVMANNIGTMADRIIATQQIQSANLAATEAALLVTQQNAASLFSSVSTVGYNATLGLVKSDGLNLSSRLQGTNLTSTNMGAELQGLVAVADSAMSRTVALFAQVEQASQLASVNIDGSTLSTIDDLGPIYAGLAASLEAYANAIEALAPYTDRGVLGDATAAMLKLTQDIGTMATRILEMNNKILVMADDIGAMAGRIITTENIQQQNLQLTQGSLLSAQNVTLNVIQTWGL
jgi:hypothetical protein